MNGTECMLPDRGDANVNTHIDAESLVVLPKNWSKGKDNERLLSW